MSALITKHRSAARFGPVADTGPEDLAGLTRLLAASVPDCSPQTVWELPWTVGRYRVVRDTAGSVVAAAMLARLDDCRFEIRGLAVSEVSRGHGLARRIMGDLLAAADAAGRETVCMTRRPSFFRQFGFRSAVPLWLPEHRWLPGSRPGPTPRIAMCRAPASAEAAA